MGGRLELVDHGKNSLNKGDHGKKSDESSFVACGACVSGVAHGRDTVQHAFFLELRWPVD